MKDEHRCIVENKEELTIQLDILPDGFFGIIGLFIGSFLNVCIYRIPRKESLVWPGSHCPGCGRPLKVIDLVPVLSYLFLRGKCRTCGARISPRYPIVELITGAAFFWSAQSAGGDVAVFAGNILLLSGLIVITFIDLDHWIIPDKVVFPLAAAGFIISWIRGMPAEAAMGAALGFFGFYAIAIIGTVLMKKEAMGGGDIKLAGMLGCFMGWKLLLTALFLSFLIGSIVSLPMLLRRKRGARDPIPFGPMMAAGAALALIKGGEILSWYGDFIAGAILPK